MKNSTNNQFLQISAIEVSGLSEKHLIEYTQFQDYCNSFSALEEAIHKFKSVVSAYKSNRSKRGRFCRKLMEEAMGMNELLSTQNRGQYAIH